MTDIPAGAIRSVDELVWGQPFYHPIPKFFSASAKRWDPPFSIIGKFRIFKLIPTEIQPKNRLIVLAKGRGLVILKDGCPVLAPWGGENKMPLFHNLWFAVAWALQNS